MSKIISPGEIAVNQYLTVFEWEPVIQEPDGIFTTNTITYRDNSYKGDILKVTAVDLPFVVVERIYGFSFGSPLTLDTRRVKLMELSPEFIAAKTKKKN